MHADAQWYCDRRRWLANQFLAELESRSVRRSDERSRLGDNEGDLIVGYPQSGYVLSVQDRKSRRTVTPHEVHSKTQPLRLKTERCI
jgi:IS30 family transposase